MVEDNARIPINMTEPVNLNLKMEAYTIIGDADEIYNRGYADGEEYGKKNAPSEDFSVTLIANGTYEYPKPEDKYHKDLSITVEVPSDYSKGYDDGYEVGKSDGYNEGLAQRQYETWTLTLADGSTVEKEIALL